MITVEYKTDDLPRDDPSYNHLFALTIILRHEGKEFHSNRIDGYRFEVNRFLKINRYPQILPVKHLPLGRKLIEFSNSQIYPDESFSGDGVRDCFPLMEMLYTSLKPLMTEFPYLCNYRKISVFRQSLKWGPCTLSLCDCKGRIQTAKCIENRDGNVIFSSANLTFIPAEEYTSDGFWADSQLAFLANERFEDFSGF